MSDWRISRKGTSCFRCGRAFEVGESFVSAIFEAEGGGEEVPEFERVDACEGCPLPEERTPISRWVTRLPEERRKGPLLDLGMARDFLVRLAKEGRPERRSLAYLLALLLLRKRKVKLIAEREEPEGTMVLDLAVKTDDPEEEEEGITVPVRTLSAEERAELEEELGRLFGLA